MNFFYKSRKKKQEIDGYIVLLRATLSDSWYAHVQPMPGILFWIINEFCISYKKNYTNIPISYRPIRFFFFVLAMWWPHHTQTYARTHTHTSPIERMKRKFNIAITLCKHVSLSESWNIYLCLSSYKIHSTSIKNNNSNIRRLEPKWEYVKCGKEMIKQVSVSVDIFQESPIKTHPTKIET